MTLAEELHVAHKERLARIASAAEHPKIKNRATTLEVPTKPFVTKPEPVVIPFDMGAWIERQKQKFKEPWFQITDGPTSFEQQDPQPIKIEHIQRVVCRHYLIDRNDMLSERRTADVVLPRHVSMYLCKMLTLRSLPEIGRRFNGRDHTTALSAIRKITRAIGKNIKFADEIEYLRKKCGGQ